MSIDHKDSTYDDQKSFASTLYNRPFDQLFVLNEIARLGKSGSGSFLSGLVDDSRTGLVGYSMGGYGVVNVIGGGYSKASETLTGAPPNRLLADRGAGSPAYVKSMDPRIKAAIARSLGEGQWLLGRRRPQGHQDPVWSKISYYLKELLFQSPSSGVLMMLGRR